MTENRQDEYSVHDWENTFDILDIIKSTMAFILVVGFVFCWFMLMLLIISFVTLSFVHFDIKYMYIVSAAAAVAAGIIYTVKTVKKYRGKVWKTRKKTKGRRNNK